MGKTSIEWATDTWNPVTGCSHAGSPGCDHCYAARLAATRLKGHPRYRGLSKMVSGHPQWSGEVRFNEDVLEQPLRWRRPRVVFPCSMADWLHPDIPHEWQARMLDIMADDRCEKHMFLLLTKRPENYRDMLFWLSECWPGDTPFNTCLEVLLRFPDNICLGVSVEAQDQMWRAEELVKIPGKHWVNFGPLLGPVTIPSELLARLAGIAVEGESGPGARPMHPDWARGIRDQCLAAGVPYTFKQWGAYVPYVDAAWNERDPIGAFRGKCIGLREAPVYGSVSEIMARVGKKAAGRELDGEIWDEFPWKLIKEA